MSRNQVSSNIRSHVSFVFKLSVHGIPGVRTLVEGDSVAIDGQASASRGVQGEVISSSYVEEEDPSVSDSKAVSFGSNERIDTLE